VVFLRRTKIIPIRLVQANHDTDWDGVPDYKDCQPLNPRKQEDVPPTPSGPLTAEKIAKEVPSTPYAGPMTAEQIAEIQRARSQQLQIPPRFYDDSIINLPVARIKFIRYIL